MATKKTKYIGDVRGKALEAMKDLPHNDRVHAFPRRKVELAQREKGKAAPF